MHLWKPYLLIAKNWKQCFNWQMDKHAQAHLYIGILLSSKRN